MSQDLRIAIAVPTRNRPLVVKRLLASVIAQYRQPDEVIIVDSSSDDKTRAVVEAMRSPLQCPSRYIRHEAGLTRQRNRAIDENSCDILVFLDDDIVLAPDFIIHMSKVFAENPSLCGIGAYIENQYGKKPDTIWRIMKFLGLLPGGYREGRVTPYGICLPLTTLQPFSGLRATEWLAGGATGWRASVFTRHRFNESLSGYCLAEDKEFSVRVSRLCRLAVCGDVRLKHLHEGDGRVEGFRLGLEMVRNHLLVLRAVLPAGAFARHYQQLWYWFVHSSLQVASGVLLGRINGLPVAFGCFWGVLTNLLPVKTR